MTAGARLPFILAPPRFPAALDQLQPNVRHVHHLVEDETISHFSMTTGIHNCHWQNNITDLPSKLIPPLLSHVNDYAINQLVWSWRA